MQTKSVFGLYADIPRPMQILLGTLPFVLMVGWYWLESSSYLAENPNGKLMPSFGQMAERLVLLATQEDRRSGDVLLWTDTYASLKRLLQGVVVSAVVGIFTGIVTAFWPLLRYALTPFITFWSNVPIISLIAVLILFLGMDELFKFMLVFLATVFIVARDVQNTALKIPNEMITKSFSLGATTFGTVFRLMLPKIMPDALKAVKMVLGTAWVYVVAAEMVKSPDGMGARMMFARRLTDMELILPYVMVITLLAFMLNIIMDLWIKSAYSWYQNDK